MQVNYDGFKAALEAGVTKQKAGILIATSARTAMSQLAPSRKVAKKNSISSTARILQKQQSAPDSAQHQEQIAGTSIFGTNKRCVTPWKRCVTRSCK